MADRNHASVGDVIITRTNKRQLRLSATDWVKNGDRWTITHVGRHGELTVRHNGSRLAVRLPADYVATSTGLGYATTIHGAQGISVDTAHGILTGQESRQQLYTMLSRGRHANHLYLQAVGDGDPHNLIRPETIAPSTPTETLQQILARDDTPSSASTQLRELNGSASRLFDAVRRYTDSLQAAAEQTVGPQKLAELDLVDKYIPGLTNEPTWPTLRAHLINLAAESGEHPLVHLQEATLGRDLSTTGDMAAVLYWRLTAFTTPDPGPLPWLPDIPARLRDDSAWGAYLTMRARLVADLASQVRDQVDREAAPPTWAAQGSHPSATLVGDVTIWRAANGIDSLDPRPTGGDQLDTALNWWKQSLDRYIALATKAPHNSEVDQQQGRRRPRRDTYADLQRSYQTPRSNPPSAPGR